MVLGISFTRRGSLWHSFSSLWQRFSSLWHSSGLWHSFSRDPRDILLSPSRMSSTPPAAAKKNAPRAPKKKGPKTILPSSQYYTEEDENNNNLSPENLNAKPVNITELVKAVKMHPGNNPVPFSHKNLNYAGVPKMKLPPHLQGGKSRRKRPQKKKTRKISRKNHA